MKEEKFQGNDEADFWRARAEELQAYEEAELKALADRAEEFEAERRKRIAGSTVTNTARSTSPQSTQQTRKESDNVISEDGTRDGMGEYMGRNVVNVDALNARFLGLEEQEEQLLPGILNEITYDRICTKLPRTEFQTLSSLNHAWEYAVGSGRFYNARVHSNSAETLALHSHSEYRDTNGDTVAVYSVRDQRCYEFPAIPQLDTGVPMACECISLNGKIYILGGEDDKGDGKKEVYVFDVVSRRQHWQQCASMQSGRYRFGCSVLDEKIFVVGGYSTYEGELPVDACEVYDPRVNAWFTTKPPQSLRGDHHVATLGGELVLYGGDDRKTFGEATDMEVYCPTTDAWRIAGPLCDKFRYPVEGVFTVEGKFHLLCQSGIYVHDSDRNSWEQLHSNSFRGIGPNESFLVEVSSTVVVNDDELVAGVRWYSIADAFDMGSCLVQTRGFRGPEEKLVWKVVPDCAFGYFTCPLVL
ncbi:unnamed protein product [Calypogeia fissa]